MKRILAIILSLIILLLCSACGTSNETKNEVSTENSKDSIKTEQIETGKEVYSSLDLASRRCSDIADKIYQSWYFAIYKTSNEEYLNYVYYCNNVGYGMDLVEDTLKELGYTEETFPFDDFNYTIKLTKKIETDLGTYKDISLELSAAKDKIKTMTSEFEESTQYSKIQKYYSEVSSFYDWVSSPSGSLSTASSTIEKFESNIKNYQNELSFIYE